MIDKMKISNRANYLRKELGEDESSPIDIFSLIQSIPNLTVVLYPLGNSISGVCYKGETSNIIAINSEMSLGRQRFSVAHELYHLYFDQEKMSTVSMKQIGQGSDNEKEADQFASFFLVPQSSLYSMIRNFKGTLNKRELSIEEVIKLEQHFGISHQAMLYRLIEEKEITFEQRSNMQSGVRNKAAKLGYNVSLYNPSSDDKKMMVFGHYINQVESLLSQDRISIGKYEELLLDAFRDDIVYGNDLYGDNNVD